MAWVFPVLSNAVKFNPGSWMPNTKRAHQDGRTHAAIDVYAPRGSTIVAPVSGTVISAGSGNISGHFVQFRGDDGITYFLGHMDSSPFVKRGQRITAGSALGQVGNSGSARRSSPHVHFEMKSRNGKINPYPYLSGGVRIGAANDPTLALLPPEDAAARQAGQRAAAGAPPFAGPRQIAQDQFRMVNPQSVAEAFVDQLGPSDPGRLDTRAMLGTVLSAISNSVAGGTRADYRTVGRRNVPLGDVQARRAGGVVEEEGDDGAAV